MLNYIARYFTLNRRERNSVLALITLLFVLMLVKYLLVYHNPARAQSVVLVELDSVAARLAAEEMLSPQPEWNGKNSTSHFTGPRKKDSLFYFDPNLVSYDQALLLGFNKGCAKMLMNYRNKGGRFYKPADLEKLYCMDKDLFSRLEPYVIITGNKKVNTVSSNRSKKEEPQQTLEINSADSAAWVSLRGIGPGYTRRILKFRSLLGGFTAVEQLKEVYNFPDSVYQSIKNYLTVDPKLVKKLKVNKEEFKTLVHHPYIKYEGTKCIFALKRGKNIKEEDLVNSSCFSREHLQKVLPYLDFSE